jgi:molybdate transport system regulatory protein
MTRGGGAPAPIPPPERRLPGRHTAPVSVRLRFENDARIGPGKVALLEAVERTGSISAAGREMGMSYRRAWLLIDSLNRIFERPAVEAKPGGVHGGGAALTPLGHELVLAYRAMEADATQAVDRHFAALRTRMVTTARGASDG